MTGLKFQTDRPNLKRYIYLLYIQALRRYWWIIVFSIFFTFVILYFYLLDMNQFITVIPLILGIFTGIFITFSFLVYITPLLINDSVEVTDQGICIKHKLYLFRRFYPYSRFKEVKLTQDDMAKSLGICRILLRLHGGYPLDFGFYTQRPVFHDSIIGLTQKEGEELYSLINKNSK